MLCHRSILTRPLLYFILTVAHMSFRQPGVAEYPVTTEYTLCHSRDPDIDIDIDVDIDIDTDIDTVIDVDTDIQ